MTTRTRNLTILAVVAVVAAIAAFRFVPRTLFQRVEGAIPASSFMVATLDVAELRGSSLGDALLAPLGHGIPAMDRMSEACGWNVLGRVSDLAIAVPEDGTAREYGIIAMADVGAQELRECADRIMGKRGGKAQVGTSAAHPRFAVLDESDEAGGDGAKIAFAPGGPLIVAREPWLSSMLSAADGTVPRLESNAEHVSLRQAVTLPSRRPLFVASALLPKALRDKLRAELAPPELAAAPGEMSSMGGILGVASAALSVTVGKKAGATEFRAEFRCETDAQCAQVKTFIERQRLTWSQDLGLRLAGLGALIDSLETKAQGAATTVAAQIATPDLAEAITRVAAMLRKAGGSRPAGDPGTSTATPAVTGAVNAPRGQSPERRDAGGRPADETLLAPARARGQPDGGSSGPGAAGKSP